MITIAALIILAATGVGFLLIRAKVRRDAALADALVRTGLGIDNPEIDEAHIGDFVAVGQQARDKGAV